MNKQQLSDKLFFAEFGVTKQEVRENIKVAIVIAIVLGFIIFCAWQYLQVLNVRDMMLFAIQ